MESTNQSLLRMKTCLFSYVCVFCAVPQNVTYFLLVLFTSWPVLCSPVSLPSALIGTNGCTVSMATKGPFLPVEQQKEQDSIPPHPRSADRVTRL